MHLILLKVDFLKEKVAVATVVGKAYFHIVNQLREQGIPFVSLFPGDSAPAEVKVVITTPQETDKIKFEEVLLFAGENGLNDLTNEVKRILQGKKAYEKIIIGLDPGMATGLAVITDGAIIEEDNCFSSQEIINCIIKIIKNVNFKVTRVIVKIGNGVPMYKDLFEALDEALPQEVMLEVVNEAGTNKPLKENKRSRGIRHISSAIRIAGRSGHIVPRSKSVAANNRRQ